MDDDPKESSRDLVGKVACLLVLALYPLPPELAPYGGLGEDAWLQLYEIENCLVRDIRFEHADHKAIQSCLYDAALAYRDSPSEARSSADEAATALLSRMAKEPFACTVYLGVEHLNLPHGITVGPAQFLRLSEEPELRESFERLGPYCPELVCAVEATAGTYELLRERARGLAETALGLVRQHTLFGFASKIYLDQVLYGLNGTWARRENGVISPAGWWRKPSPIPMDLGGKDWVDKLMQLSHLYNGLQPEMRSRVDTCLGWLDVAALSENWRIIITAVFSAMESLLVPDNGGNKGCRLAVRAIAVHVAMERDSDYPNAYEAYRLRNNLSHGTPVSEILSADAVNYAERLRLWAFAVLTDYLELAVSRKSASAEDLVKGLDAVECQVACDLLLGHGHPDVVNQFRNKGGRRN